jgi:putative exosortase-associated protein (TIGR04073 family)
MKKRLILSACLITGSFLLTPSANAEDYLSGFTNKFSQGISNMASGFLEIPKNVINITHEDNILMGMTWGILRGAAEGVTRTLVGSIEFISSPIPSSEFASPAYAWERFSEDSRYFGLHYPGYWTTYGPLDDGE